MATETYEVLVEELTVLRTTSRLPQPDGSVVCVNGMGAVFFEGEKIPSEEVADDWKEALESRKGALYEHLSKKLRKSRSEAQVDLSKRLGLPFDGYNDMDEDDILAAMAVLPSATVQAIKEFESARDDGARDRIVQFNIGYGESPTDRQLTDASDITQEGDDTKVVGTLRTRSVPQSGPVIPGEGITGTGDPADPPPTGTDPARKKAGLRETTEKASRRGRKPRSSSGGSSNKSQNQKGDGEPSS